MVLWVRDPVSDIVQCVRQQRMCRVANLCDEARLPEQQPRTLGLASLPVELLPLEIGVTPKMGLLSR